MPAVPVKVTEANTAETLFECPPIREYELKMIMIQNTGTGNVTVTIADTFKTENGSEIAIPKFVETLSAGEKLNIRTQGIVFKGVVTIEATATTLQGVLGLEEV